MQMQISLVDLHKSGSYRRRVLLSYLAGFGASLGLIVVIGAQNAFVLRQGIKREWVLPVVVLCALSDAVLIFAGVAGIGAAVQGAPVVLQVIRWVGAAFLLTYGFFAAQRALRPGALQAAAGAGAATLGATLATVLALTWLNPHVYLDTLVLLGSLANAQGEGRWAFGVGAASASALWFPLIGYGARALSGFFARPASWRVLDGAVALLMVGLAGMLLFGG
ncbi:Putative amino acid transporter [Sinomonas atrocyanea]|uniref:Putative amino acid transporter n=1 Tax=Sinomonas atrocyanea TaxID=37927 RepID=A0A126ZUJ6_9MICC|nr:LysE/ArgO family amino acid transporter [Sinomonas atrocyanea]AMM30763.1 Putative amino acid transporter [Sinomonas atrocyanea]GEB63809.1 amino acid transporter [Sinomonas atrocyanea]GGG65029.1 amino acid transporter [Sinomonas atrocyanea]